MVYGRVKGSKRDVAAGKIPNPLGVFGVVDRPLDVLLRRLRFRLRLGIRLPSIQLSQETLEPDFPLVMDRTTQKLEWEVFDS